MNERLQETLNRKPSKWGNLTVKEFERDIKLLQERVQELEELTHKQGKVIIKQSDELDIFDQQNKRYREALEFYADEENYEFETIVSDCDIEVVSKVLDDYGQKARKALEREG